MLLYLAILAALILAYLIKYVSYTRSEYYKQTGYGMGTVWSDKGKLGEYYTYKCLRPLDGYKRYLFNVYIPKDNGETTEVDIILLHESGVYVFESKNYSGWIFGSENQKTWTQT